MEKLFVKDGRKIWVSTRVYAWVIGIGLVLFCVHHEQFVVEYGGHTVLFLPWVGVALIGMALFSLHGKKDFKWELGNKKIWIPLLVIVVMVPVSGYVNYGFSMKALAPTLFAGILFAVYVASRSLGDDVFYAFVPAVVIQSIGCVVMCLRLRGMDYMEVFRNGGFISPWNYDISAGLLVFGALVGAWKGRWWLSAVAITGLFFSGAEEGILGVGVVFLAILTKKDWSKKLLVPVGALVLVLAVCTPLGITEGLYSPLVKRVAGVKQAVMQTEIGKKVEIDRILPQLDDIELDTEEGATPDEFLEEASGERWLTHWQYEYNEVLGLLVGQGYNINEFYYGIQHNVPLLIVYQIGIFPALAWLWVTGFCLFRYRQKEYVFIALVALSAVDHYFWTQVAGWWWALVGVASAGEIKREYIFKEVKGEENQVKQVGTKGVGEFKC